MKINLKKKHPFQSVLVHSPLKCRSSLFPFPVWPLQIYPESSTYQLEIAVTYCPSQHQILFPSPVTTTAVPCFHFDSISSFLLELFLCSSLVAYWHLPTWRFHFSLPYLFLPLAAIHGVLMTRTLKCFVCPFLLQWTTFFQNYPTSWLALHSMSHTFMEWDKAVIHLINLFSLLWLWFFILSAFWWVRIWS